MNWLPLIRVVPISLPTMFPRCKNNLPRIGEGWISEIQLYNLVKSIFPEAQHHATPEWLKPQHLDVFVRSKNLAFEYQGLQHFEPVEFFGGEEAFEKTKKLDERKRIICKANRILLIHWLYNEPINQEALVEKLNHLNIYENAQFNKSSNFM